MPKNDGRIWVKEFVCLRCGACCRQLPLFQGMYDALDRGDGVCRHFDLRTRLCKIYDHRPKICDVRNSYAFFKEIMSFEAYLHYTALGCGFLREQLRHKSR